MDVDFLKLCELVECTDEVHNFRNRIEPTLLRNVEYDIEAKKQEINEIQRQISNIANE